MDSEVEFLMKNRQYRIIRMAGENFILDLEKSIWLIFIPFLFWLMPQRMYKVDVNIVEELKAPTSGANNSGGIVMIGAGGAAILSPLIKPILNFTIQSTVLVNLLLLIGSAAIIIFFRLYMRQSLRNRINKTIDIEKLDTVKVKIKPKYFKQYIFPIFSYLFCGIFVIGSSLLFLETSNFIPLISFLVFLPFLLIVNTAVIHPNLGKTNLYRVSLVN